MTQCLRCKASHQLYLCDTCIHQLDNMLDQIPWLLAELDARIQNLARITTGTIGRRRRPDELNAMDFDAAETARAVRKTLLDWVDKIAERHLGRPPAGLQYVVTGDLARWIRANLHHVARDSRAGKLYDAIKTLVGEDQRGGQLIRAINPVEKHAAGPCPTITGRDRHGAPRECATMLFADTYDRTTTCPTCGQEIDVEQNRIRANAARDLHTSSDIVEILININEAVDFDQLELWIQARRLRPRGYLHDGTIVEFRIQPHDEPVYSVERARKLRRRDANLRTRQRSRSHT